MLSGIWSRLIGNRKRSVKPQSGGQPLSHDIEVNIRTLNRKFNDATDLLVKQFFLGGRSSLRVAIVYLESLGDGSMIEETVIEPLMILARPNQIGRLPRGRFIDQIRSRLLPAQAVRGIRTYDDAIKEILDGHSVFLIDGIGTALTIETKGFPGRGIQEPAVEVTTRGPRDSFTETIRENIALIRRRVKSPELAVERFFIGQKSVTDVRMMYLHGVALPEQVAEVRRRIRSVNTDMVLDSGTIAQLITEHPFTLFPTIRATERPDTVSSDLNEGRIALVVDTTPFVLLLPSTFWMFFASPEDHYIGFPVSSFLRLLRFAGFVLSVMIGPFFVAMVSYHQELIPLPLLLNVAATQAGVPFPVAVTAITAEIIVEILREAGVRLPQQFGPAVSIVGALVLGQAAVQAGFISPGLVIVVLLGTIASFAIPRTEAVQSFRLLRFPEYVLAATLGFFGLALASTVIIFHAASLKSLGIPFLSLYTPGRVRELAEKVAVPPSQWAPRVRPTAGRDRVRRGPAPKPSDPWLGWDPRGSESP